MVVVVVGDTGAGKSTLLNALMGERSLLPTNGMRACTAAIVELSFNHNPCAGYPYSGCVDFVTREQWQQELEGLYSALEDPETGALPQQPPREGSPGHAAWWKLRSVFGTVMPRSHLQVPHSVEEVAQWLQHVLPREAGRAAAAAALEEEVDGEVLMTLTEQEAVQLFGLHESCGETDEALLLPFATALGAARAAAVVDNVLGTRVDIQVPTSAELHAEVSKYVDSTNNASSAALWPLVSRVQLRGPWPCLRPGVRLVDAPGVRDDNSARDAVVKSYLRRCDGVWLVSNVRRAVNDKTVKECLRPSFKRALLARGRLGSLAFVATQTDMLVRSEIAHDLHLPESATTEQCALARNAFTKRWLVGEFYDNLVDLDPSSGAGGEEETAAAAAAAQPGTAEAISLWGAGEETMAAAAAGSAAAAVSGGVVGGGIGGRQEDPAAAERRRLDEQLPPAAAMQALMALQEKASSRGPGLLTTNPARVPGCMAALASVRAALLERSPMAGGAAGSGSSGSNSGASGNGSNLHGGAGGGSSGSNSGGDVAARSPPAAPGQHWGDFVPMQQLAPGIMQYRWTDDGGAIRNAPCLVEAPEGVPHASCDGFQFGCFTVSAVDYQRLAGLRTGDGKPSAFASIRDTEVEQLREFLAATATAAAAEEARSRASIVGLQRLIGETFPRMCLLDDQRNQRDASGRRKPFPQRCQDELERLERLYGQACEQLTQLQAVAESRFLPGAALLDCLEAAAKQRQAGDEEDMEDEDMEGGGEEEEEEEQRQGGETGDVGSGGAPDQHHHQQQQLYRDPYVLGPLSFVLPHPVWTCPALMPSKGLADYTLPDRTLGRTWRDPMQRFLKDTKCNIWSYVFSPVWKLSSGRALEDEMRAIPSEYGQVRTKHISERAWMLTKVRDGSGVGPQKCASRNVRNETACSRCGAIRPTDGLPSVYLEQMAQQATQAEHAQQQAQQQQQAQLQVASAQQAAQSQQAAQAQLQVTQAQQLLQQAQEQYQQLKLFQAQQAALSQQHAQQHQQLMHRAGLEAQRLRENERKEVEQRDEQEAVQRARKAAEDAQHRQQEAARREELARQRQELAQLEMMRRQELERVRQQQAQQELARRQALARQRQEHAQQGQALARRMHADALRRQQEEVARKLRQEAAQRQAAVAVEAAATPTTAAEQQQQRQHLAVQQQQPCAAAAVALLSSAPRRPSALQLARERLQAIQQAGAGAEERDEEGGPASSSEEGGPASSSEEEGPASSSE